MKGNSVPEWKLEMYLVGALPADEIAAIAALERSDDELRGRISEIRASDAEIRAEYPAAALARKALAALPAGAGGVVGVNSAGGIGVVERIMGAFSGGMPRWAVPAFVCGAVLIAVPVYLAFTEIAGGRIQGGFETAAGIKGGADGMEDALAMFQNTRTKGAVGAEAPSPSLEVWRKAGDIAEMLPQEASASAGDIVQLRYVVPESCYGALVSVDGRGVLTVHLSGSDGHAVQLTAGRPVALNTSYKLDDAPAFEAFYLITSPESFELEAVRRRLMNAKHPIDGPHALSPPEMRVTAFTLIKSDGKGIN
ncbi:MAG: DUF4384 domain-containing protein [Chitinispirillia bacterium]|nr:DUF4384 domain-containing protein [Chitinispirillia bacterium]MCL2268491.1 DUF4384 domain-containing protein [Chitinispirillia bacterium]